MKTNQKLDKDRFRQDLGGVEEAYQEVARRLGLLQPEEESAVLDLDSHRKKRGEVHTASIRARRCACPRRRRASSSASRDATLVMMSERRVELAPDEVARIGVGGIPQSLTFTDTSHECTSCARAPMQAPGAAIAIGSSVIGQPDRQPSAGKLFDLGCRNPAVQRLPMHRV